MIDEPLPGSAIEFNLQPPLTITGFDLIAKLILPKMEPIASVGSSEPSILHKAVVLGIVAGVLGAVKTRFGGYLLSIDAHASAAKRLLGEPILWMTLLLHRFAPLV